MPVGVRAPCSDVASAVRAIDISGGAHHFLGVSVEGVCGVVKSTGHPDVLAMLPVDGAAAGDGFAGALRRLHEQRPQTALVKAPAQTERVFRPR
jgi:3-deoxy-D-arabino-heptulosonate 7-phosphate (DAHP) synthase